MTAVRPERTAGQSPDDVLRSADGAEAPDSFVRFYEPGSRADLGFRLMRRIVVTARRWRAHVDKALRSEGQSQARWETLLCLACAPDGLTQGELARRVSVEDPTMARMIGTLEREGYVRRAIGSDDRRVRVVRPTGAGEARFAGMQAATDALRFSILQDLDEEELVVAMRILDKMIGRLEAAQN
jgi:MarR family transcriptional regulator for hemolysin